MLLLFTLAMSAQSVSATPPQPAQADDEYIINDVWADKSKCNLGNAERIDLAALTAGPSALLGRCVVVNGYLSGRALFLSKADSRTRYAQSTDVLKLRRLGLYGLEKASPAMPTKPGPHEIVGTVGDCERLGDGAIMVMGYCHYTSGLYVAVSELRRVR